MRLLEVWSGGQTGVDRAACDAAIALGIDTRGWVPRGRLAEDGMIPHSYPGLVETGSDDYAERTTFNVRDTDATLILCSGEVTGGSAFTLDEARRLGRAVLVLDIARSSRQQAVVRIRAWMEGLSGSRLNVAGPRASTCPGIHAEARAILLDALATSRVRP